MRPTNARSGLDVVFSALLAHIGCVDEPPKRYGKSRIDRCELASCRMYGEHDEHEPADLRPGKAARRHQRPRRGAANLRTGTP